MGNHRHLPGRGQRSDPRHLGESASDGQVGLGGVERVALEERAEGADPPEGLAADHGEAERARHVRVPFDVVRHDRLLEPGEPLLLEPPPGLDGGADRVALVGVGEEDHVGAHDLAHAGRRAPVRLRVHPDLHLHGAEARRDDPLGLTPVGPVRVTARLEVGPVGVSGDTSPDGAAEQARDRLAEGAAAEIPERHVHGRQGHQARALTLVAEALVHRLPEAPVLEGILAEDGGGEGGLDDRPRRRR